jgi:hypothetical protein
MAATMFSPFLEPVKTDGNGNDPYFRQEIIYT